MDQHLPVAALDPDHQGVGGRRAGRSPAPACRGAGVVGVAGEGRPEHPAHGTAGAVAPQRRRPAASCRAAPARSRCRSRSQRSSNRDRNRSWDRTTSAAVAATASATRPRTTSATAKVSTKASHRITSSTCQAIQSPTLRAIGGAPARRSGPSIRGRSAGRGLGQHLQEHGGGASRPAGVDAADGDDLRAGPEGRVDQLDQVRVPTASSAATVLAGTKDAPRPGWPSSWPPRCCPAPGRCRSARRPGGRWRW